MAKTVKTTKDKARSLLTVVNQFPTSKVGADVHKYINCRKAVKKVLEDYIEAESALVEKLQNAAKVAQEKHINKYNDKLSVLEKKDSLTEEELKQSTDIKRQRGAFMSEAQREQKELDNKFITDVVEPLEKEKCEIVFDNEEFLFLNTFITDNATELFKGRDNKGEPTDMFNIDLMEDILDLLSNAE